MKTFSQLSTDGQRALALLAREGDNSAAADIITGLQGTINRYAYKYFNSRESEYDDCLQEVRWKLFEKVIPQCPVETWEGDLVVYFSGRIKWLTLAAACKLYSDRPDLLPQGIDGETFDIPYQSNEDIDGVLDITLARTNAPKPLQVDSLPTPGKVTVQAKLRKGRPKALSQDDEEYLRSLAKENPGIGSYNLLRLSGLRVHRNTILAFMQREGLQQRPPRRA
jgi:hypothetical protein